MNPVKIRGVVRTRFSRDENRRHEYLASADRQPSYSVNCNWMGFVGVAVVLPTRWTAIGGGSTTATPAYRRLAVIVGLQLDFCHKFLPVGKNIYSYTRRCFATLIRRLIDKLLWSEHRRPSAVSARHVVRGSRLLDADIVSTQLVRPRRRMEHDCMTRKRLLRIEGIAAESQSACAPIVRRGVMNSVGGDVTTAVTVTRTEYSQPIAHQ